MPIELRNRPLRPVEIAFLAVVALLVFLVLSLEFLYPPPHPLGRFTSGPWRYVALALLCAIAIGGYKLTTGLWGVWTRRSQDRETENPEHPATKSGP